ncbi:hypothetical protein BU17DRAFT_96630 [Hysterangium stoloniferum]|nr:hypothetical protein BU17DRAFT_96630 [Hysterangium stoloniferum]
MAAFFSRPTSAAVKIVAPSRPDGSPAPQLPQDQNPTFPNLGNHKSICVHKAILANDLQGRAHERTHMGIPSGSSELSRNASPFQPQHPGASSRQNVNAPVFIPKNAVNQDRTQLSPDPALSIPSPPPSDTFDHDPYDPYDTSGINGEILQQHLIPGLQNMQIHSAYDRSDSSSNQAQMLAHSTSSAAGLDSFYQTSMNSFIRQPLNYHLYTPISHAAALTKSDQPQTSFFMSDSLRQELTERAEAIRSVPLAVSSNLPEELQGYHSLVPLDHALSTNDRRPNFGSWHSSVYKATSSTDSLAYVLMRIENFRLPHESAFGAIEQWSRVRHPSIVSVREAFTTRAFNDNSLIVSYDYHPNATTLFDAHLRISQRSHGSVMNSHLSIPTPIPEAVLWTYITQIGNAIRTAHSLGLAVRMVDATKILLTGKNRVRIGSCGVGDVVAYDARQDVHILQQEDILQFGRLILALCCNNLAAANNLTKSLEVVMRNYTPDLKTVILFLISKPSPVKSINQLFEMIGSRLLTEMEALQHQSDRLEHDLASELENGRIVRLLCKLGFINERPEFDRDLRWSETGDRYIIKLFRDYVFHQVDENGAPIVNMSHVLTCLNKLDAGTNERIMLVSRDEQSCLVVSYKELKACIESTFNELARGASR